MSPHAFSPAYEQAVAAPPRLRERAAAVALLVLLHAALIFLIGPKFRVQREPVQAGEVTLSFEISTREEIAPYPITPELIRPTAPVVARPIVPPSAVQPEVPSMATPDITGLGRSLFDCNLANSADLTPGERANCRNFTIAPPASGMAEAGMPKASRTKHGAIWAAALAARRKPVEVPCTSVQQQVFGGPGVEKPVTALMADPLCLLNGLLNGFSDQGK